MWEPTKWLYILKRSVATQIKEVKRGSSLKPQKKYEMLGNSLNEYSPLGKFIKLAFESLIDLLESISIVISADNNVRNKSLSFGQF